MPTEAITFAQQLRSQTAAVRLRHKKLGVKKALSPAQLAEAAEVFGAISDALSASKKILNTRNEKYRAVVGVRRAATEYWRLVTVAYPEPGIRLLKRDRVAEFNARMQQFRGELDQAVKELQQVYQELIEAAQINLGTLYRERDYPEELAGEFGLDWDYPSIEPPAYLKELNPALYEQEQKRIAAKFDEAVRLTEEALSAELQDLVCHLCDKLSGSADGKPKQVRQSAVDNLCQFFDRFTEIGIRSNEQLNQLVEQAKQVVSGVDVERLKKDGDLRGSLAEKMQEVKQQIGTLVVARPTRAYRWEEESEWHSDGVTE